MDNIKLKKLSYLLPSNFVALDIETTGLQPEIASILSISAAKFENGIEVDSINCYVNNALNKSNPSDVIISDMITDLTGISNDDITKKGISLDNAISQLINLIQPEPYFLIVGHNIQFDLRFIYYNMYRYNIPGYDIITELERYDTYWFERKYHHSDLGYSLELVAQRYGVDLSDPHISKNDALASAKIAIAQQRLLGNELYVNVDAHVYVPDDNSVSMRFKTRDGRPPVNTSVSNMVRSIGLNEDLKSILMNWRLSIFPKVAVRPVEISNSKITAAYFGTFVDMASRELSGYNSFALDKLNLLKSANVPDFLRSDSKITQLKNSYYRLFNESQHKTPINQLRILLIKTQLSMDLRKLMESSLIYKPSQLNDLITDMLSDDATMSLIKKGLKSAINISKYVHEHTFIQPEFFMIGGYTDNISTGDGDYLLDGKVMDLKTGNGSFNIDHALQVILYGIMGRHSTLKYWQRFDGSLELIYPLQGRRYTFNLNDIPKDIYYQIEHNIIGY